MVKCLCNINYNFKNICVRDMSIYKLELVIHRMPKSNTGNDYFVNIIVFCLKQYYEIISLMKT